MLFKLLVIEYYWGWEVNKWKIIFIIGFSFVDICFIFLLDNDEKN